MQSIATLDGRDSPPSDPFLASKLVFFIVRFYIDNLF